MGSLQPAATAPAPFHLRLRPTQLHCRLQVPTLYSATVQQRPGTSAAPAPQRASGGSSGGQQGAAPAGSLTERAVGLNLNSPAGRYSLDLQHPAAKHTVGQLLSLKARLAAFQQQQEAAAAAAAAAWAGGGGAAAAARRRSGVPGVSAAPGSGRPGSAAAGGAPAAAAAEDAAALAALTKWPARRSSTHDYVAAIVRRASRSEAPQAGEAGAAGGGEAARASASSQRRLAAGDGRGPDGACGAPRAERRAPQRFPVPPVDALGITDIQLDGGRPIRLDKLLELSPWLPACKAAVSPAAQTGSPGQEQKQPGPQQPPSIAKGAGGGGSGGGAKPKPTRSYRRLAFTVRIAALPSAEEPAVLPAHLLQWAVKVRRGSCWSRVVGFHLPMGLTGRKLLHRCINWLSFPQPGLSMPAHTKVMSQHKTPDAWRLQLTELLLQDWLLAPAQARALLACFDPEMGQEQRLSAAQLVYARLAQPMEYWGAVLSAALKPLQAAEFARLAGPWLTALDRTNLTGHYVLNLGRPLDRCVGSQTGDPRPRCRTERTVRAAASSNVRTFPLTLPRSQGRRAAPAAGRLAGERVARQPLLCGLAQRIPERRAAAARGPHQAAGWTRDHPRTRARVRALPLLWESMMGGGGPLLSLPCPTLPCPPQNYTIPASGTLKLDFVKYGLPGDAAVTDAALKGLLARLRAARAAYLNAVRGARRGHEGQPWAGKAG
jgi:hypothetical protein